MKSIRVLVANRPRLIRELMMETIFDQPDIDIVGEIQEESELVEAVDRTRPDFLIVALDKQNRLPVACHSIMQSHPSTKVIAISPDGNSSIFYWASFHLESNGIEASETGILNALRGKSQPTMRLQ